MLNAGCKTHKGFPEAALTDMGYTLALGAANHLHLWRFCATEVRNPPRVRYRLYATAHTQAAVEGWEKLCSGIRRNSLLISGQRQFWIQKGRG